MPAAPAKKPEVEAYKNDALKMLNPKRPDSTGKVKPKDVHFPKHTQARQDTDSGEVVDTNRVKDFAEKMRNKVEFPPIKIITVTDMPGMIDKEVDVCWDGFHTGLGALEAGLTEIPAHKWKGTWAQALAAAAVLANQEHENNGKPKSFKDKLRSLHMYVKGLSWAGVGKKDYPSNRQLALMFGISHTAVGDEDPCERRKTDTKPKEQKLKEKKDQRQNGVQSGQAHMGTLPPEGHKRFEVIRRATQEAQGTFTAETVAGALEEFKKKTPGAVLTDFTVRELTTTPPKPGTEKSVGFDWQRMEADVGGVVRGWEAAGDIFDLKKTGEWKRAQAAMNTFLEVMKATKTQTATAKKPKEETAKA